MVIAISSVVESMRSVNVMLVENSFILGVGQFAREHALQIMMTHRCCNTTCGLSDRESATAAHESLRRQELACVVLFVGTPYFYITSNPKVGFEKKNIKMEANGGINHDLSTLEPLESEYRETAWGIEKSGEKHKPLWIARPKTTDFAVKFEMLVINSCFV